MNAPAADWPDRLYDVLKRADIRQVGYVPDAGHARLIERCRADPQIRDVVLTTEEEGVALAAGAWLGGETRLKTLDGTLFARVAIEAAEPPRVLPERDGTVLKRRFRAAIGVKP